MSFEHPNRNNESMIDVERDIMSRPSERNTTNLDLQRMKMILDIMGHPEQSFRVIHITGTNGKGSTARMAEAICRAYGMRTGLYTSPHLEHVNERIAIDGQQLSDDDFVDTWDQIKDLVAMVDMKMEELDKPKMSFFEVLTAMAIWKFADAPVDVAIVEVGMGGRWDATNVLDADAAIIGRSTWIIWHGLAIPWNRSHPKKSALSSRAAPRSSGVNRMKRPSCRLSRKRRGRTMPIW